MSGDEIYRGTLKADGHYVWCDRYENGIGDNIALVQELEPGTGFAESVYKLVGSPRVNPPPMKHPAPTRQPPTLLPQSDDDLLQGRAYLARRGISADTIGHAEKSGMVRYATGAVLFVGYDEKGTPQSITRRATDPAAPIQKRDFARSDKSYPTILSGDQNAVWIVEGGADALALHDLYKRRDKQPPIVLVSGGANIRSFLERPEIQSILKQAKRVVIAHENEKGPATQQRTDAAHQKQADRVAEITQLTVESWTPKPAQGKDLADMNYRQQQKMKPVQLMSTMRDAAKQSTGSTPSPVMNDFAQ